MEGMFVQRLLSGRFTLIAEIGVNYYDIAALEGISPIEAAELMIDRAASAKVHAAKFQTYKAAALAAKKSPAYWDLSEEPAKSQYELFQRYDSFGKREYARLAERCGRRGIEFLSTPFDFESADYLCDLMGAYKISSSDITNIPFVEHIARKGKAILLSTGASDKAEIDCAIAAIRRHNDRPLAIMHCVLEYPAPYADANLRRIGALKHEYPGCVVGYSDHTKPDRGFDVLKTAYALGAAVIEKHFTLDKSLPGNDHYHAMDEADAKGIVSGIAFIDSILGSGGLSHNAAERPARQFARRSIASAKAIAKGAPVGAEHLAFKRPGDGIPPSEFGILVGKRPAIDIAEDTILQWDMFE
ncbi:MAG: N-acetylneuraminate synthase family protein [Clostridiales Family XIII bacterium]|jgi:N-acetylneuraminate synthase|nr:N-acetylneuraminate synthase family protein [Clostridiales Family XIII bacterium]